MSNSPFTTASDSLTFYDVYRADQDQLERRLAQIRLHREIRAERTAGAARRVHGRQAGPRQRRHLRDLLGHWNHSASARHARVA